MLVIHVIKSATYSNSAYSKARKQVNICSSRTGKEIALDFFFISQKRQLATTSLLWQRYI